VGLIGFQIIQTGICQRVNDCFVLNTAAGQHNPLALYTPGIDNFCRFVKIIDSFAGFAQFDRDRDPTHASTYARMWDNLAEIIGFKWFFKIHAQIGFQLKVKIQPALYIDWDTVWFLVAQNSTNPFAGSPTHYHHQAEKIGYATNYHVCEL